MVNYYWTFQFWGGVPGRKLDNQKFFNNFVIEWIVLISRLGSVQNYLLNFFYHDLNRKFSTSRVSFSDNIPQNYRGIELCGPLRPKCGSCLFFFQKKNNFDFLKNQLLHFIPQGISRHFLFSVKKIQTGNVGCYLWFLATRTLLAESSKTCIIEWFVLIIKFRFFSKQPAEFFTSGF